MKKDCKPLREAMNLSVVGELDPADRERLDGHLEHCSTCAQEKEELQETLREMSHLEDVDAPRSFFLPLENDRLGPLAAFRLLPTAWKAALMAATLALAVGAVLGWSQLSVTVQDGALVAHYGPMPDTESESLAQELHDLEKRLEQRDLEVLHAIEKEQSELRSEVQWNLVHLLEKGLRDHERRMEPRWQILREQARSDTESVMEVGLATLHESWQTDMEELSLAMRLTMARDFAQEEQMTMMTRALLEVADDRQTDG